MKRQFIDQILVQIQTVKIDKTPAYRTMMALANHPARLFPREIVGGITIDVNESFVNDPELFHPTVNAYVNLLNTLYSALQRDVGHEDAVKILTFQAQKMSLTYTF